MLTGYFVIHDLDGERTLSKSVTVPTIVKVTIPYAYFSVLPGTGGNFLYCNMNNKRDNFITEVKIVINSTHLVKYIGTGVMQKLIK